MSVYPRQKAVVSEYSTHIMRDGREPSVCGTGARQGSLQCTPQGILSIRLATEIQHHHRALWKHQQCVHWVLKYIWHPHVYCVKDFHGFSQKQWPSVIVTEESFFFLLTKFGVFYSRFSEGPV